MISDTLETVINRNGKVLKIVWGVLLAAIVFYVILSIIFNTEQSVLYKKLEIIFVIIGIILSLISIFIYKKFLSISFLKRRVLKTKENDYVSDDNIINNLSTREKRLYKLFNFLFIPHLIVWGINESVVLLGFILSYLTRNFENMLPFATVGIILHLYTYPKLNSILETAKNWEELNS